MNTNTNDTTNASGNANPADQLKIDPVNAPGAQPKKEPWYKTAADWIEEHPVTVLGTICAIGITAECIILATRKQS